MGGIDIPTYIQYIHKNSARVGIFLSLVGYCCPWWDIVVPGGILLSLVGLNIYGRIYP